MPDLTVERIIQNFEVLGNWEDRYGHELRTAALSLRARKASNSIAPTRYPSHRRGFLLVGGVKPSQNL